MLDRREFLETLGGGVLVLVAPASGASHDPFPPQLAAWLHIAQDGAVTVYTGKVECGQGPRTSLAQAVAEELRTPLGGIRLIMGDTDQTAYDMGTFGSRSTPYMAPQLRKAGAAARELLVDLAAQRWNVDRAGLVAGGGKVANPRTGQSASYGELADGKKLMATIAADVALTPPDQWKVMGTPAPKVNAEAIVTGRHRYPSDMKLDGMLYGRVVRPSSFGAKLTSADTSHAEAMAGVQVVREGDFLGVVAPHPRTAKRAAAAIKAQWSETAQPSADEIFDYLKNHEEAKARPEEFPVQITRTRSGTLRSELIQRTPASSRAPSRIPETPAIKVIRHQRVHYKKWKAEGEMRNAKGE